MLLIFYNREPIAFGLIFRQFIHKELWINHFIYQKKPATVCARDLDKPNLVKLSSVLGSNQFLQLPQLPQKMISLQKWPKVTQKIILIR